VRHARGSRPYSRNRWHAANIDFEGLHTSFGFGRKTVLMSVDGVANVASIVGAVLAVPSLVQIFRTKRVADEVKDRVSSVEAKLAKLSAVMLSRQ